MGKRRRERDRPKAAHDAMYNPNKRVLLSYESDEGDDPSSRSVGTLRHEAVEVPTPDHQVKEYDGDEADGDDGCAVAERSQQACGAEPGLEEKVEGEKRAQLVKKNRAWSHNVRANHFTGQKPALGALSYQWEDEEVAEEEGDSCDEEAMAYLRAVRSERQGIPPILKARVTEEVEEIYNPGIGDGRGYIDDGAYIARPSFGPSIPEGAITTVSAQDAFHQSLKTRFRKQHDILHATFGQTSSCEEQNCYPTSSIKQDHASRKEWLELMQTTAPVLAQVQKLEQGLVLELIGLVQKSYLVAGRYIVRRTSAWIWSLLARLDDVGTMNNDEVSSVREFGKRAVLVQVSLQNPAMAEQLQLASQGQQEDGDGDWASTSDQKSSDHTTPDATSKYPTLDHTLRQNTHATLDMIIVVVGDVFRQRDILVAFEEWPTESGAAVC